MIRVKRHSVAGFFHRNPLNVCKTSFRTSEYSLDISLPRRRVKISRWWFPSILLRVFLLTSLYAIFCRWVSFLTDHSTPDLASTSYKGLVKFQFREKWRKEVLKIPRFRKTLNSNQPRYYGFRIGRERTQ